MATSTLRQATAADIPGMWEVRYAVTENTLTPGRLSDEQFRAAIEDTGRGWLIEADGDIQGFAVGHATTGNVWALFVHPRAQGLGYGARLHTAMIDWFGTQPVDMLWLSTGRDTRARQFYQKHGWRSDGPYGADEIKYIRVNERG
jgi:GNAT superfamily N-acetyltransferase